MSILKRKLQKNVLMFVKRVELSERNKGIDRNEI